MNNQNSNEAILAFWSAIEPRINALIKEKIKDCIKAKRATVAVAADAATGKMGVKFPFENAIIYLPYSSAVSAATIGAEVWVIIPHGNNLSNGVIVQNGTWTL